jgi:hypothetical protein
MTTKQYTGLLALICVLGSGFAANQWLKFAKAQHAYQKQLALEKQRQLVSLALYDAPIAAEGGLSP